MNILVFIQSLDGKININSLEALVAAQKISEHDDADIQAITFDKNISQELNSYKLSNVIYVANDELNEYNPLLYLKCLELLNNELSPDLILFGHTYQTRDWVPRLSARLDYPFISDCINFENDGNLTFIRPIYQAKLNEKISLKGNGIISFQAGSFSKDELVQGSSTIKEKSVDLSSVELTINPGERFKESTGGVDLSKADIIVSIGRGISKKENIPLVKLLAEKTNIILLSFDLCL